MKIRLFLLLAVAVCACRSHDLPVVNFAVERTRPVLTDISSLASSVRYIPMQSFSETGKLGYLHNFVDDGKHYYVTDTYGIYRYTHAGEFVTQFENWGGEAGQYGRVYCMDMPPERNCIYARTLDEMIRADTAGTFLDRRVIDGAENHRRFYLSVFCINPKGVFLFRNPTSRYSNVAVLACNAELDSLKAFPNTSSKEKMNYAAMPKFGSDGRNFYYKENASDTLMMITPRLKKKNCLIFAEQPAGDTLLRTVPIDVDVHALENLFCFRTERCVVLYFRRSGRTLCPISPEGEYGIFIQHIPWSVLSGKENRLYLQALAKDIIRRKDRITDPELKKIAGELTEDSDIVLLELTFDGKIE